MPYYALFYKEVAPDYVARRTAFRDQHLDLARESHARGELLLGGALADPVDGALLIFRTADAKTVEAFVQRDPYVTHGLVKKWEIRPWTVVVGELTGASSK